MRGLGVVILACTLLSVTAGCESWVPVRPAALQAALNSSGDEKDVLVKSGDKRPHPAVGLVVHDGVACRVATAYVLSGRSSPSELRATTLPYWVEAGDGSREIYSGSSSPEGEAALPAAGCACLHPPCINVDVSRDIVMVRRSNPGATAGVAVAIVVGVVVVALSVVLVVALSQQPNGGGSCWLCR